MIVDAHTHFFPDRLFHAIWDWFEAHGWSIRYRIQADEVATRLKGAGIDRFVLLNYSHRPGMSESLNAWTHAFAQHHPEAIPFGAIHPEDPTLELDRCFRDYRFYGIKFHCHVTAIRPDDDRMFPIYEKIIEYDKILTLHAGNGPSLKGYKEKTQEVSGVRFVRNLLKRFPSLKLIIPHLGADEFDPFFDLMGEHPNLMMDTTMALAGWFPLKVPWERIEAFAPRILYGSDFPNITYEMTREIEAIRGSGLTAAAQEAILGENARRIFNLSDLSVNLSPS